MSERTKDIENFVKQYPKLYDKLPEHLTGQPVENSGLSGPSGQKSGPEIVKEFLKQHVPKSDQKEIDEVFAKNLPLATQQKRKITQPQPRKKNKYLTAREKRDLKLSKLDRNGLKYEHFKKLHFLWRDYMNEIIDFEKLEKSENFDPKSERIPAILDENLQLKICRADFHGCNLKVSKAKNSCLVGLQGIVVMETRHTFQLIDKKSVLRNIPKNGTSFTFLLNGHVITIQGSSFICKPSDRAVKKWKRKQTFDL